MVRDEQRLEAQKEGGGKKNECDPSGKIKVTFFLLLFLRAVASARNGRLDDCTKGLLLSLELKGLGGAPRKTLSGQYGANR